jgi:hypothetical protein
MSTNKVTIEKIPNGEKWECYDCIDRQEKGLQVNPATWIVAFSVGAGWEQCFRLCTKCMNDWKNEQIKAI